jgi:hypothetical protein
MHLWSGRVAGDKDAVGNSQLVVWPELSVLEADADHLEPKLRERWRAADREQDLVTLDTFAVSRGR